jgi:hypothetical protein
VTNQQAGSPLPLSAVQSFFLIGLFPHRAALQEGLAEVETTLEAVDGVTEMHADYYRVSAEFHKVGTSLFLSPAFSTPPLPPVSHHGSVPFHPTSSTRQISATFTPTPSASWGAQM